jgi:serine/threonine-protein kinase
MERGAGAEAPGLEIGSEFAGHRIVGVLGKGGMGVVYRARKLALDRERALKVIAPALSDDARFRERFKRESRMAAAIEHPNVIPVHDAGEENGMLYLAMRLVEGSDLHRLVRAERRLGDRRTASIIAGVGAALDAAHAQGLVHRDVKPANVLIESTADGERVYLTDFGITRTTTGGETLTGTGEFVGSVEYIAPEQAAGEHVDARTDVYSLGGVAHFALTGRPPFPRENSLATLFAHANAPRPRPTEIDPNLPPAVDAVIVKAMATDPGDRHPSAGELAADLTRALGVAPGELDTPVPPTASAPGITAASDPTAPGETAADLETRALPRGGASRRRLLPAALLVAAVVAVAAVVLLATGGGGDERSGQPGEGSPAGSAPQPRNAKEINVGDSPSGIAVGPEKVWVAARGVGDVQAVDPRSNEADPPAASIPSVASVAVAFDSIWAVSPPESAVYRLDPLEGTAPVKIPVGIAPSDVAFDENYIWVANQGDNTVSRIDPEANEVDATEEVGAAPRSLAAGEGSVWVANIDAGSISRIDAATAKREGSAIAMPGSRPNDVAVGEGSVWVIDNVDGTLTEIDPDAQRVEGEPIQVGALPRGVKAGLGYVWVANGGDSTVVRVDPSSLELVGKPVDVGADPADLAIGLDAVWTADEAASTVTRIDPGT